MTRMRRRLERFLREVRRILKGRISRADATRRVEGLLRRLEQPTLYLQRVSRVVVYGSYARGAMRVGDVDLAIDYEGGANMIDRPAIDAVVARLAAALAEVDRVAPALNSDSRSRARILAADAARVRRQMTDGLPPVRAMFDPLRESPMAGDPAAVVDDLELARLEVNLAAAVGDFDVTLDPAVPFPAGTPSLAPVENLNRMIDELTGGDERLSIYYHGADMPYDRAVENPGALWLWILLWERGDPLDVALARLHAIKPDHAAGRAPRSGQTGVGFKL